MKKKLLIFAITFCFFTGIMVFAYSEYGFIQAELAPHFRIFIGGVQKAFRNANGDEVTPIIVDGTTYLPIRGLSENLGKAVEWDEENNAISINEAFSVSSSFGEVSKAEQLSNQFILRHLIRSSQGEKSIGIIQINAYKIDEIKNINISENESIEFDVYFTLTNIKGEEIPQANHLKFTRTAQDFYYKLDFIGSAGVSTYDFWAEYFTNKALATTNGRGDVMGAIIFYEDRTCSYDVFGGRFVGTYTATPYNQEWIITIDVPDKGYIYVNFYPKGETVFQAGHMSNTAHRFFWYCDKEWVSFYDKR